MKKNLLVTMLIGGIVSATAASAISGLVPTGRQKSVHGTKSVKIKKAAPAHTVRSSNALFAAPAPNISYPSPLTFTAGVPITPISPTNTGGAVPAHAYGQVTTVAGDGTANVFDHPLSVAADGSGFVFVADTRHNQIKTVTTSGSPNNVSILSDPDGSPYLFNDPVSLSFSSAASDFANLLAVQKAPDGRFNVTSALEHSDLDGLLFPNARGVLNLGLGFYLITTGNEIYSIKGDGGRADSWGNNTASGMVNGDLWYNVRFNRPVGLAFENHLHQGLGNVFVADAGNNAIRKIALEDSYQNNNTSGGFVTTFAGNGTAGSANGTGGGARFNNPTGVVADQLGNIYVADAGNNMIRKITPGRAVTTFAGTGAVGAANGKAAVATFNNPQGITIDSDGVLYIADTDNNLIRSVSTTGYTISPALPAGLNFDATTGTISGAPLAPIAAADYTVIAYNTAGSSLTTVNITVIGTPPPNISYTGSPYVFTRGATITPLVPNNTGGAVPANVYNKVTTFSGSTTAGSLNGPKSIATFNGPSGITIDSAGSIYVADYGNYKVRRITYSGVVGTFAGTDLPGADNYVRTNASFNSPAGLAIDTGGNIYVADPGNFKIRKINHLGGASTAAGRGIPGQLNGIPGNSSFNKPYAVNVDIDGNVLIADTYNNVIRKLVPGVGVTTLNVGVTFNHPEGIISDASGNIFVSDFDGNKIYKITWNGSAYTTTTFAGSGTAGMADGSGTTASFSGPRGMTFDYTGNLYVADYNNSLIRKITPAGVVTTQAGMTGTHGSTNGIGTAASFWNPAGIATDKDNNLYVADYSNNMVRKISLTGYSITPSLPLGLIFDGTTGTIAGTLKQTLPATIYTITAYNASGSSTTTISIEGLQRVSTFMANSLQDAPVEPGEPSVKKLLSPNGDGNNDVLAVENIEQYPDNKMTILNAAGGKVYEASGYGIDSKLFDGHASANGQMQPSGTYFYLLEYQSKEGVKRKTGYFVIKQ